MTDDPAVHKTPLIVTDELLVITHASYWLIRPDTYLRAPRRSGPRPPTPSIDGALDDSVWHPHQGVWLITTATYRRYRILPTGRPPGATGIVTGEVIAANGT